MQYSEHMFSADTAILTEGYFAPVNDSGDVNLNLGTAKDYAAHTAEWLLRIAVAALCLGVATTVFRGLGKPSLWRC